MYWVGRLCRHIWRRRFAKNTNPDQDVETPQELHQSYICSVTTDESKLQGGLGPDTVGNVKVDEEDGTTSNESETSLASDGEKSNTNNRPNEIPPKHKKAAEDTSTTPPPAPMVRKETREFLDTLHNYLQCREAMDKVYEEVDGGHSIAKLDLSTDSGGIELQSDSCNPNDYKPEYQQQTTAGHPVTSIDELYEAAERAKPVFSGIITEMVNDVKKSPQMADDGTFGCKYNEAKDKQVDALDVKLAPAMGADSEHNHGVSVSWVYDASKQMMACIGCADTVSLDQDVSPDSIDEVEDKDAAMAITFAPLKGRDRAIEKADDDYSKRKPGPGVSWLYDIVRGTVYVETVDQIKHCIDWLQRSDKVHIVKAKNRFAKPDLTGYRDLCFHIRITIPVDDVQTKLQQKFLHVCEIQIHHKGIKETAIRHRSHDHYEYFREYFAGATGSTDALSERLDDLKLIGRGEGVTPTLISDLMNTTTDPVRLGRLGDLFCNHVSEYELAYKLYERCLALVQLLPATREKQVGIAECRTSMGMALQKQGKYIEALSSYEQALNIRKVALGVKDHDVGVTYNNIANVLCLQGKHDEAFQMYEQVLDIYKGSIGSDYHLVGDCYHNMATVLGLQGKYDEAWSLHEKTLETRKKSLGNDHPKVSGCYNSMGSVLAARGRHDEALKLYEQGLNILKRSLGNDHFDVGSTYRYMASALANQGKYNEAFKLHEEGLNILIRTVGNVHPDVGMSYESMASLLARQRKYEEALPLFEQALDICKQSLGNDHPKVGHHCANLANVCQSQGNYDKALLFYEQALDIFTRSLGDQHPNVGTTCYNMALTLQKQGKYEEAQPLHMQAAIITKSSFGIYHPSVADCYNNLAVVLEKQEKYDEAVSSYEEAVLIYAMTLHMDYPMHTKLYAHQEALKLTKKLDDLNANQEQT